MKPVARAFLLLTLLFLCACARMGEERFTSGAAEGTVLDTQTGLMWAAIDNQADVNWEEADRYCREYRGGGFSDWRLPSEEELKALYEAGIRTSSGKKSIGEDAAGTTTIRVSDRSLWSSTIQENSAAYCNFSNGVCFAFEKSVSLTLRALPVRTVSTKEGGMQGEKTSRESPPEEKSRETAGSSADRLRVLQQLYEDKLLSKEEYQAKRKALVEEL